MVAASCGLSSLRVFLARYSLKYLRTPSTVRRHFACFRVSFAVGQLEDHVLPANFSCHSLISLLVGLRPSFLYSSRHHALNGSQKPRGLLPSDQRFAGALEELPGCLEEELGCPDGEADCFLLSTCCWTSFTSICSCSRSLFLASSSTLPPSCAGGGLITVAGMYCLAVCIIAGSCWIMRATSGEMLGSEKPRPSREVMRWKLEFDGSTGCEFLISSCSLLTLPTRLLFHRFFCGSLMCCTVDSIGGTSSLGSVSADWSSNRAARRRSYCRFLNRLPRSTITSGFQERLSSPFASHNPVLLAVPCFVGRPPTDFDRLRRCLHFSRSTSLRAGTLRSSLPCPRGRR